MSKLTLAALAALVVAAVVVAPAGAKVDKDCSDFPTQKAAQKWFKHHGPRQGPSGLDADHDEIACEATRRHPGNLGRRST